MKQETFSERKTCLILYLSSAALLGIPALFLQNTEVMDETGTMSIAAFLAGRDWSLTNLSQGSYYYKYFQSLFYVPFIKWIENPFLRYRLILFCQALLLAGVCVLAYHICRKYLDMGQGLALGASICCTFLSPYVIYMWFARADLFLEVIPWLVLLVLIRSMRADKEGDKKKKDRFSILAAFLCAAAYASHSRGLVLILAVLLSALIVRLCYRQKVLSYLPFMLTLAILLGADRAAGNFFKKHVWPYGIGHATMGSYKASALKKILTLPGFKALVKLCLGWMYNACTSTCGLVLAGLLGTLLLLRRALRNPEETRRVPLLMGLLGSFYFLGSAAMGILFFYPKALGIFKGSAIVRADRLVYTRYMGVAAGILALTGIDCLLREGLLSRLRQKLAMLGLFGLCLAAFGWKLGPVLNQSSLSIRNILNLCRFVDPEVSVRIHATIPDFSGRLLLLGWLSFTVFALFLFLSIPRAGRLAALAMIVAFNLENAGFVYSRILLPRDRLVGEQTVPLYEQLSPLKNLEDGLRVVYLDRGLSPIYVQPVLDTFKVVNYKSADRIDTENAFFVLRDREEVLREQLDGKEAYLLSSFTLKEKTYNIYVAGGALAEETFQAGYALEPYTSQT